MLPIGAVTDLSADSKDSAAAGLCHTCRDRRRQPPGIALQDAPSDIHDGVIPDDLRHLRADLGRWRCELQRLDSED